MKVRYGIFALALLAAVACNRVKLYNADKGEVIATAGGKALYSSDVAGMIEPGLPPQDSLALLRSIAENWVRKELKTSAAETALKGDRQDIEQMVNEYRGTLLTYRFEQEWLVPRLDTAVTVRQITEYYNENRDDFRLSGPIVKAMIARIPAGLRQSKRLEEMFRSDKESDRDDFINICIKNQYRIDDFTHEWTDFSTVIQHLPFQQTNFDEFLRTRKYYDVEDDQYKYMMLITAFLPTGDIAPQERETDNIRRIILNKRRQGLVTHLEDSLYRAASQNRTFDIKLK